MKPEDSHGQCQKSNIFTSPLGKPLKSLIGVKSELLSQTNYKFELISQTRQPGKQVTTYPGKV